MIRRPGLEVRMWPLSKMASTIWTRWTRGDAIASPPEMWTAARCPHAIMAAGSETPSRRSRLDGSSWKRGDPWGRRDWPAIEENDAESPAAMSQRRFAGAVVVGEDYPRGHDLCRWDRKVRKYRGSCLVTYTKFQGLIFMGGWVACLKTRENERVIINKCRKELVEICRKKRRDKREMKIIFDLHKCFA
jgi:hypothetical protein